MYCPKCRVEFREGFKRCAACGVALVHDRPLAPEPEYVKLVTVFLGDSNSAAAARSRVEGAGIESWVKDEEVHSVFPCLGSTEVLVAEKDEKAALSALETV